MTVTFEQLVGDQKRRIYRDFLKGVPKEDIIKKYDISEGDFWKVYELYARKRHPNDVGGAEDISGPLDLLVTPLDTGSPATEHPMVARSPRDLRVAHERVIEEFDWEADKARVDGVRHTEHVAEEAEKARREEEKEVHEAVKKNKENTDAVLAELTEKSEAEAKAIGKEAVKQAKATPSVEDLLKERQERTEDTLVMEAGATAAIEQAQAEHAEKASKEYEKLKEAGDKATEKALKDADAARQKEAETRRKEFESRRKEAENRAKSESEGRAREADKRGDPNKVGALSGGESPSGEASKPESGGGSAEGDGQAQASGNTPAEGQKESDPRSGTGDKGGEGNRPEQAVTKPGTSSTAQPNAVEPAKVEPDGLKAKK